MSSYLSQFNYQLYGPESGRPWVFLHGLMGYGSNWRKIVSALEPSERILTFDQRGHGRSMKPSTGYAPEDYAEDLFLISEELGWNRFILVGHSMGGRNAMIFAAKFPEKVEKLVIEDMGPESKPGAEGYYRRLLDAVPTPFANKLAAKEFFLNEFPKLGLGNTQPGTLGAYLYSNIVDTEVGQADWRFSRQAMIDSVLLGRGKDHWEEYESLSMPVLIVRGQSSTEFSKEVYQEMLRRNSQSQGLEIANAGHWVHSDQPQAFIKAIQDFAGGF